MKQLPQSHDMSKMIHTRSDERTQHQRLATTQQLEEKGRNEQEKAAIDPDPVAAVVFAVSILCFYPTDACEDDTRN
jgi:hypothetical protein